MVSGFIQTKQPKKANGLEQKNMAKELRHGQMVIFIRENLRIVSGVA